MSNHVATVPTRDVNTATQRTTGPDSSSAEIGLGDVATRATSQTLHVLSEKTICTNKLKRRTGGPPTIPDK